MVELVNRLIVGSQQDPHVRAVVDALGQAPAVFDVQTLQELTFEFSPPYIRIRAPEWKLEVGPQTCGWLRRLSPLSWEAGTIIGSHEAVDKASRLALLAALLRHPDIRWLSSVDPLTAAENKLTQYTVAARLGIPIPRTVVSNSPSIVASLSGELIAKPLGPGHFQDSDGRWLTVFTDTFHVTDSDQTDLLSGPPFIVQSLMHPTAHLRVVTVQDQAWVYRLPAAGLPIDWREVDRGHRQWERAEGGDVARQARLLAGAHKLGYSSQDWIESGDALVFLDLNPSGQWLFLPSPGANEITAGIARWLAESCV